jgi:hypothetical protein
MKMLTRRRLITTTAQAAMAGAFLPFLPACTESIPLPESVLIGRSPLVDFLLTYSNVSYAGPTCATKLGLQPDTEPLALQQALSASLDEKLASLAGRDIGQRLQQAAQTDFTQDRVLDIDGWQLSETECQAAALAASMQGFTEPVEVALAPPTEIDFVEVTNWGPRSTLQGETFNEQPDGHSGIWIKASGIPPATIMLFDGKPQNSEVYAEHMTSGIHGKFMNTTITQPGVHTIDLYDRSQNRIQRLGEFEVLERTVPVPFYKCRIATWGPVQTVEGETFNEQPSGSSAVWIRTNCAQDGVVVMMDGNDLVTTIRQRDGLVTARVEKGHELAAGDYRLELRFGDSGNVLPIGDMKVNPATP